MKQFVVPWILMLMPFPSIGQDLEITVKNVGNDKGVLMVGLFNSEKTFTTHPWKADKSKAKAGVVRIIFHDVPSGEYAVSIFHDENENGLLDSNFMGIPKEGFGFSNDAMGTFGPPTFRKAKFTQAGSKVISVTMKYY
jgi:uncharacterized protein (DUF2141 family)